MTLSHLFDDFLSGHAINLQLEGQGSFHHVAISVKVSLRNDTYRLDIIKTDANKDSGSGSLFILHCVYVFTHRWSGHEFRAMD